MEKAVRQEPYQKARIGVDDLDFSEVPDHFTLAEMVCCQNLGFCPREKGEFCRIGSHPTRKAALAHCCGGGVGDDTGASAGFILKE